MTDELVNWIKIEGNKLAGNVATVAFDVDVFGETADEEEDAEPLQRVYRLFASSPRGRRVEIGAVWERPGTDGMPAYSMTLHTGHGRWYARLVRFPGREDDGLYQVCPHDHLNGCH